MIIKLVGIILGSLILQSVQSASAQIALPFYEGFDYTAGGNLAGNGSWGSAATTIKVNAASLGYAGLPASVGNDVSLIPGSSAGRTYLNFAGQTSGTVYFSFLFQINTAPSAQRLLAYGHNSTSSSSTPYLGIFVTSSDQLAVGIGTSSPQFTSSALTAGVTYLVVIAYTFGATDSAQIWINPASFGGAAPAVSGSFTSTAHNSGLSYFQLNTPSAGTGGGSYELDELRIGLNWADVVPADGPVALGINTQPQSRSVGVGQGTTFSVGVVGDAPLRYLWYFNSSPSLPNATNATFTLASVQRSNAGDYTVVVTNDSGAVTSSIATLTVTNKSPVANADSFSRAAGSAIVIPFATLLANDNDPDGDSVTLAGITLVTTNGVILATNATAVTYPNGASVSDRFTYTIADGFGGSASGSVNITVSTTVTEKLKSFHATPTNTWAMFSGTPSNLYHLQRSLDMTNWATLFSTNSPTNGLFQVVDNFTDLSNAPERVYYRFLRAATTNAAVAPGIVTPPQSLTVTQGLTAVFSVVAGGDAPLAYQWRFNGTAQSGATNDSLTFNNVQTNQAGNYSVVVANAAGAVTSSVAVLTVVLSSSPPAITTQPASQTVFVGDNTTFSVVASGAAPLRYQWFFNNAAQASATNSSFPLIGVTTDQAGNYFVRVTNNFGAVTSSVVTLTANPAPTGGVYYVATTGNDANAGTFAAPFATLAKALSVMASGDTIYVRGGNYAFSAQVKPTLAGTAGNYCKLWAYPGERPIMDFSATASGTKALYLSKDYWHVKGLEIANAQDNGIIVAGGNSNIVEGCIVHDCDNDGIRLGSSSATSSYTLILNCDSYRNFQVSSGGNNGDGFSAKIGTGPGTVFRGCRSWNNSDDGWDFYDNDTNTIILENCITYANGLNLWGVSGFSGNGNGFKLGGASTHAQHIVRNCLAIQNVHDGFDQNYNSGGTTVYNCTGYGNGGVTFQFPDTPTAGVDVLKNNVSYSGTIAVNASAVQASNSWQNFTVTAADFVSLDTSAATNARNADYSLPEIPLLHLTAGSQLIDRGVDVGLPYNGSAPDLGAYETSGATSSVAPAISAPPTNQTVAAGGNATFTVTATGTAPLSYQWFFNNVAQTGATNSAFALTSVTTNQAGNVDVGLPYNGSAPDLGAYESGMASPTAPSITTSPTNQTVTNGQTATFTVTASGPAPLSYQWFFNNATQPGATNTSLVLAGVVTNQAGNYFVRVTNSAGAVTSAVVTLTVVVAPVAPAITTPPASQSVAPGSNVTFTVAASGSAPLSYQWLFNSDAQSGATNPAFTLTSVTTNQAGSYSVRVTNSVGAVTSAVAALTVTVAPTNGVYYVATNGSDSNPGTLDAPFATLEKATSVVLPGNSIYMRGGTYYPSVTIVITNAATAANRLQLLAYPGEQPFLNFTNQPYADANRGILFTTNSSYWNIKGIEIGYAGDNGVKVEGNHLRFEQCSFHHNGDTGIQIGFGHTDANPGGQLAAYIEVINCDSYLNYDSKTKGGNADGFAAKMHCGQGIVFTGCRAWTNSDDGWDFFETDYGVVLSNCWVWGSGVASGNGNGFKMGGNGSGGDSQGIHAAYRCVAFGCKVNGFTQNSHKDGEAVFNCLSFSNGASGYNYFFEGSLNSGKQNVFKNNVGIRRNPASASNNFIEDNVPIQVSNTWNLTVTANPADYGDLSAAAAGAPRQADGSLPTGFARLVAGSDLIDQGVDVGMAFPVNGAAPDLGPYESP